MEIIIFVSIPKQLKLNYLFHKRAFVFIGLAFVVGILIAANFAIQFDQNVFFLLVPVTLLLWLFRKKISHHLFLFSGLTLVCCLGIFSFQNVSPRINQEWVSYLDHENFTASVVISEVGNYEKDWVKCIGKVSKVYVGDSSISRSFDVLIYVESSANKLQKGDEILFRAPLNEIANKGNPGEFDAEMYWNTKGIRYLSFLNDGDFLIVDQHQPNFLVRFTDQVFYYCSSFFKRNFEEQEGAVLSAIVLGDKSALDTETMNSFLNTGTMHVLAVSGMHFGLLMVMMMALFERFSKFISRKKALFFLLCFFWFYAFLTGMSASVVRAIFMFSMLVIAQLSNRKYDSLNVLFFSAFVLLLINPLYLFDIGFQLSYLAMVGIFLFYDPIRNFIKVGNRYLKWLWEGTAVGLAAQLMTVPISLYYFHQFPNYFLLSNWVLMLTANFILGFGVGVLLVSKLPFIFKPIAFVLGGVVTVSLIALSWIEYLPGAVAYGFNLHFLQVVLMVAICFILLYFRVRKILLSLAVFALLLSFGLISWQRLDRMNSKELCVFNSNETILALKNRDEILCFYDEKASFKFKKVEMLLKDYCKLNPGKVKYILLSNKKVELKNHSFSTIVTPQEKYLDLQVDGKRYCLLKPYQSLEIENTLVIGSVRSLNCDYYLEKGALVELIK